jgi:hypothetical protein
MRKSCRENTCLTSVPTVELQRDGDENEGDYWLALLLLLQEQEDMGETVRESCNRYITGDVDLIVAATVTDSAITLAQKA